MAYVDGSVKIVRERPNQKCLLCTSIVGFISVEMQERHKFL